jgi:hypothetical protein
LQKDVSCLSISGLLDDLFKAPEVIGGEPLKAPIDGLAIEDVDIVFDLASNAEVSGPHLLIVVPRPLRGPSFVLWARLKAFQPVICPAFDCGADLVGDFPAGDTWHVDRDLVHSCDPYAKSQSSYPSWVRLFDLRCSLLWRG